MLSHRRQNKILKRQRHYARIAAQVAERLAPEQMPFPDNPKRGLNVSISREEIYFDAVSAIWPLKVGVSSLGMRHISVT